MSKDLQFGLTHFPLNLRTRFHANLKFIMPVLVGVKLRLFLGLCCLLLSSVFLVNGSVFLGKICARLGELYQSPAWLQPQSLGTLSHLINGFILFEIANVCAQYTGRAFLASGTNQALFQLRKSLFVKLSRLPMTYFDNQPMGRIITRLTNDVEGVEGFFGGGLARIATACVQVILVLVGIVAVAPKFGFYIVLSAIPSLVFGWFTRKPVHFWLRENKARNAHLNSTLAEFIQGLPVLRILGLEKWSSDVVYSDAKKYLDSSLKVLTLNSMIRPLTVFLSVMPTLVTTILGGIFLSTGKIDLAVVVAILRLTERFTNPVRVITQEIQMIQDAMASSVRVKEMLMEPEELKDLSANFGGYKSVVEGEIEFENVWLSYRNGYDVLKSLSLKIPAGQKIGIVGATGAGKSSILNMIPRLYLPHTGVVKIDGVNINDWHLDSLRSQIGYLAQDPFLFKGTLGQNILGVSQVNIVEVQNRFFALMAELGLMDIFKRYPQGFDFEVRENGVNLSSGEKQMISFMRLMHEDRPILLMDEATSCLDKAWESAIQAAILGLMKQRKRTCVIIAHRLETLLSCDRIIRIGNGQIIGEGTPDKYLQII